jgi:hemolysin activation/secretion protein
LKYNAVKLRVGKQLDHIEYFSNATLSGNLTYKRGTGWLNAMRAPEEDFGEAYTRVGILQANASLQVLLASRVSKICNI